MNTIIPRKRDLDRLKRLMRTFPVTCLIGPRQCGKTTLARSLERDHYFDLENPRDMGLFDTPQLNLEKLEGTIVIDEVQRKPELFPLLRYLVDRYPSQRYLILGSASPEILRESSETLAGRIGFHELSPFTVDLAKEEHADRLWLRGGFPRSFLAESNESSSLWRENYIRTFLERDIPQLGITIPSRTLRRFWTMLSHYHGQLLNLSELGRAFGISDKTIGKYLDILAGTFVVRLLQPWYSNVGKRLVRSPRLYVRDSGLFHLLQSIDTPGGLASHPKVGASWEGFVLEQAITLLEIGEPYFWRTHTGAELDLFWFRNGKPYGLEVKYSDAPGMARSLHSVIEDLKPEHIWIIYPGKETWQVHPKVTVLPLTGLLQIKQ
jgi:uncharacterized protein